MSEEDAVIDAVEILELIENLSQIGNDSIKLQRFINQFLTRVTGAEYVFLLPILTSNDEGLIQVVGDRILDKEMRFAVSVADIEQAIQSSYPFKVSDLQSDFGEMVDSVMELAGQPPKPDDTLVYAINAWSGNEAGINQHWVSPQAMNQSGGEAQINGSYLPEHSIGVLVCIVGNPSSQDTYGRCIKETFRYVLGHLLTAIELFEEERVRGQCQNLLRVARRLLGKIGDLGKLLRGVMAEAKDLADAERCSLFLIDKYTGELVSKVFDGNEVSKEFRIQNGQGIAGHVAKTGKLLNIRNAYQHKLFYKGVDEATGFKTKNILCFPICDEENIIGVAQLCNKANGFHFDKCDEEIATAFSIYCGISIMHALVHKRVQKAEARHKLSQEMLLHHMKVPEADVEIVIQKSYTSKVDMDKFSMLTYCPRDISRSDSIVISIEMFSDLGILNKFKIHPDKMARFLLLVQKGYREMPYHNWTHAFSVAHFGYCLIKNLQLVQKGIFTDLQTLSFLIACFCHDLDHRGTSNSYQMQAKSPLAKLYSSEGSVNERHHLSQAICILNDGECKILDSLNNAEFKECIDYLRELILATDLAHHFSILRDLQELNASNLIEKRKLLMPLMITSCDLSDQIKPWPTTQHVADLVYAEFFAQGDLEKQMGLSPKEMMDRQKACVPELQIEFISTVVRPSFEILANVFPETQICVDTIDDNRCHWEAMRDQQPSYSSP